MDEPTPANNGQSFDESAEEKDLRANLEKDEFQKQLDKAIEERRLTDVMPTLYEFDAKTREYKIDVLGVEYKHLVKAPEIVDEMRREAMSVTIRKSAGRFQGDDLVESVTDNANALRRFYDGLAQQVWGYPINEGDNPETWVDTTTVVEPYVVPEGAERNGHKDKLLLDFIPDADKIKVAAQIHGGSCFVLHEKGKRMRSIKTRREYIVKQLFGIERTDEGELSRPTHVVAYHFSEGSADDIGYFDKYCVSSKTLIKKEGQPEERRVINVEKTGLLFDRMINYIQGASINSEEVRQLGLGDERLKQVPTRCKTDAVFVYMNFLKS